MKELPKKFNPQQQILEDGPRIVPRLFLGLVLNGPPVGGQARRKVTLTCTVGPRAEEHPARAQRGPPPTRGRPR
eukprot:3195889-Pyramimonas_sp.AAC.1